MNIITWLQKPEFKAIWEKIIQYDPDELLSKICSVKEVNSMLDRKIGIALGNGNAFGMHVIMLIVIACIAIYMYYYAASRRYKQHIHLSTGWG
ncbi:hypothetical protein [Paenibacillus campi]|uniref:hypothetical protein n=1 Tax=Paenibacillus campi TaxID=3106031 RepID=UPI002AFF5EB2|nr:hypothetical protein [Paenibacillus sp. SGZ-1014]